MNQPTQSPAPGSAGRPQVARPGTEAGAPSGESSTLQKWNLRRDIVAAVLLVLALLLPWNIYFGTGVPDSNIWVWLVLILASVAALAAVGLTHLGSHKISGPDFDPAAAARRRLLLSAPYLVLVVAFFGYAVVQTVRFGGSPDVPPGVGPGAWAGVAGALLAAQPTLTGRDDARIAVWLKTTRYIGIASIALAVLFVLFNQFWRIHYLFSQSDGFGSRDIAVIVTVVLYGVVALIAVVIGSRWLLQERRAPRLAAITLGAASVVAGIVVWVLPIGRDIDAFHGIAQSSGTAAVGFEGYLLWAAAAAVLGPVTLRRLAAGTDRSAWHQASRYLLLLIGFWAGASVVLRASDLIIAAALGLNYSAYDSIALLAFDLVTAALAFWLRKQIERESLAPNVVSAISGALFVLTVCRIIVGVALAPRYRYEGPPYPSDNPVYGNDLVQQFTSTFDVVLIGLALAVLLVAIIVGQLGELRTPRRLKRKAVAKRPAPANSAPATAKIPSTSAATHSIPAATEAIPRDPATSATPAATQGWAATTASPTTAIPRIFRQGDDAPATQQIGRTDGATQQFPTSGVPRIYREPSDSTQRIPATTDNPPDATTQLPVSGRPRIHRRSEPGPSDDTDPPTTQRPRAD